MTIKDRDLDRDGPTRLPSAPPPDAQLGRIIEMAFTGLWVIRRQGALTEVGGRLYWPDRASLERAAAQAGVQLSDIIIHTGRLGSDRR
ncbi:hypothetical protein HUE56_11285 [Azospirillum oryzae]|uniref:Uncharacterized protein n=1 Tax=Azospirillum oryzae TaxID=286727 RepID=A0A6N1AHQ4_9PROT|nr:hypothetical protein [Azospirillum oryzae]KAA0589251.1 hypothetical protein FZ938_06300 [Azospirillum oryzae]QKS51090.1 hypothetical protein HUE56_11285 [Azospirillum oryzae]GLR79631.1 hypothetical protein GCM10007856_23060 [Azospirillum oryzae]